MHSQPWVAVLPTPQPEYLAAIALGGGVAVELADNTDGLVWTDSQSPHALGEILRSHPNLSWVQLPFAGVDNFKEVFSNVLSSSRAITFTSAKGAYREPVAEHALTLALALARVLPERIRANTWGRKFAASLYDSNVVIVGGGGIAEELIRLLSPFRAEITVVRRTPTDMEGVDCVLPLTGLNAALPAADFVFLAAALTDETKGLFDDSRFGLMKASSYLVNIARGAMVDSQALERALTNGVIAGAGIDVTDPEPLPDGHELWSTPNLIITPHTADTPEMCIRLLSERIVHNVSALQTEKPLLGLVNLKLGY
jgi:phosphoglycerate dehydrogenase-like enzyme